MHWGNILIKDTDEKTLSYVIDGLQYAVETENKMATIIDFSLSRLEPNIGKEVENEEDTVIFNDLSKDTTLFKAKGDYQFDIYR